MSVPPFHGNISFHAQHSPMGAFFSFTCGHFGSRGGFGLQIGKPGNQNLYIGVKDGDRKSDAPLKCLPFFEGADADEAARFDVEKKAGESKPGITSYRREEIQRHYGWATDRWVTDGLTFSIYSPFGSLPSLEDGDAASDWSWPELEQRYRLLPGIAATLTIDNRKGKTTRTAVFAMKFPDPGVRLIERGVDLAAGFAWRDSYAVAAQVVRNDKGGSPEAPFLVMRWDVAESLRDVNAVHLLGNTPGVGVEVPAGETATIQFVFAAHVAGEATTRLKGRYAYNRYLPDLARTLNAGFRHFDQLVEDAADADKRLVESKLSADQQFLIAHATRSYYGSTQLLDVGGQPFWVVNEGEYCMLNTLDLSVDQVFWELKQNPWVVRNLLDNFVRHYSYVDQHGLSFCHDMGVHNQFSPFGHSSYELPNLNAACFSYMTCEELCNWILMAASCVAKTKDMEWLRGSAHVLRACLDSLDNRTGENGMVAFDSSRCGDGGAEITTYDSLDHSLAQTRNNIYMGVKAWASFVGLDAMFEMLGDAESADLCLDRIVLAADEIGRIAAADGVLPAVNEPENPGFGSRILPAAEGLMYVHYWKTCGLENVAVNATLHEGQTDDEFFMRLSRFRERLKRHTLALLKDPHRRNLFEDGGIKLSSTSNNSWMSKIAIFQHVCRKVFKLDEDPEIREIFAKADAAHVKWMTEGESAYWACSDQFVSGVAKGSKYYPRIITTALWMEP